MSKPILLHCGDDVRWNHELYAKVQDKFEIKRSHSMDRDEFKSALRSRQFGDFLAIFRPFYSTGATSYPLRAKYMLLAQLATTVSLSRHGDSRRVRTFQTVLDSRRRNHSSLSRVEDIADAIIFVRLGVDIERLAKRGIIYCNSAAACTEYVADAAIYLIINTFRRFTFSSLAARSCNVDRFQEAQHGLADVTTNPRGHTLGIVGLGRIGYRIAQKAHLVFPMKIAYHDIKRQSEEIESELEATFHESLDDMLAVADCTVVATPYGGSKVLDADKISKMKQGSRLINIARGKLLDEDALVKALESGQLSAAALDVHHEEPAVNPKLAAMKNVELTSHNAGTSIDSLKGFETISMENILSFLETGKALTPVNLQCFANN